MDYNRTVKDLNGLSEEEFFRKVEEILMSKSESNKPVSPKKKHEFGMYMNKQWFILKAKDGLLMKVIL